MDGKTHRTIGTAAGAAAGLTAVSNTDSLWEAILALAGGALGGNIGARLPDWIEPAIHPNHRNFAHSVTAGTSVVTYAAKKTRSWETHCRQQAAHYAELLKDRELDPLARLKYFFLEFIWRIAVGVGRGLAAGYASHLALDSKTPRSIPLLVSGY